ncbi:MAG: flavin reductase family protein [Anaerolineales bacterium]|nr:flavin reductase family protein [Chloroflexota bacterium]MBL6983203.1 flavin reductase family protein [Anaerolineales bacterium]
MSEEIKNALRLMPYGFYAVSTKTDEDVNVMVMNWVTQVSFEPRMLALGLAKNAHSRGLIERGKVFALNIFNKADADLIKPFTKSRSKNPDKIKDAKFTSGPQTGCPILEGVAAYVECRVVKIVDIGGDHDIVVGEVISAGVRKPGEAGDTLSLPDLGWSYAG